MRYVSVIAALLFPVGVRAQLPIAWPQPHASVVLGTKWPIGVGISVRVARPASKPAERSRSSAGSSASRRTTMARASATNVLSTARRYVGTPYVYGGTSPAGFDCSGFVQYVFGRNGVSLPRTSRQQAGVGRALATDVDALRAGDLVMFASKGRGTRINHVAIYAGDGRIIHSTSSGQGVRYDTLATPRGKWFARHMVAARRVISGGRSLVLPLELNFAPGATLTLDPPDIAPAP